MLDPEKLNYYFEVFKEIGPTDIIPLFKQVNTRKLKAGEIYIPEGKMYKKVAYIKKGLVRCWLLKPNGEEATTFVRWEDQFIASPDCILFDRSSRSTWVAMEDTTLLELDYQMLQTLFDRNPKLEKGRKFFLTRMVADLMEKVESFILLSPEERYLQFIKQKPDIVNRVPDKYIASLLGITPVSLSRIRKRLTKS